MVAYGQLVMENDLLKKPPDSRAAQRRNILRREWPDGLSIRRGCRLMNLARSTYYYQPQARRKDDDALIAQIEAICAVGVENPGA